MLPNIEINKPILIALTGPTASGKSSLSIQLAELLPGCEIISADSMQVYRFMDIGTAKPDRQTRSRVPHHLIDVVEPTEDYNVSRYEQEASMILERLIRLEKPIILVGGTGLYVKALIDGLNHAPAGDPAIRQRLELEAQSLGIGTLYQRLAELDPKAAEKIHPNNLRRIVRALEVYELSGKVFSRFHEEQVSPPWRDRFFWFGLSVENQILDQRIDERTAGMFKDGLVDEVKSLLQMGCREQHTSMQGLGYKEVVWGLRENQPMEEMQRLVAQRTRRYARRQMTWWRPEKRIRWLNASQPECRNRLSEEILRVVFQQLANPVI